MYFSWHILIFLNIICSITSLVTFHFLTQCCFFFCSIKSMVIHDTNLLNLVLFSCFCFANFGLCIHRKEADSTSYTANFLSRTSVKKCSGSHIRSYKSDTGTNTETNQTQAPWALNISGSTFPIHVGWHPLVLLLALLLHLTDQTANTWSRFISKTLQSPKLCAVV